MKNQNTEGCPRCDDYDEVVEELKKEKDSRERGVKEELRKCEEGKKGKDKKIKALEKKVLAMTIAAVVGGTILGKDFVDEIASYIKSFNSVKDAASNLTGSLPITTKDEVAKKEDEEPEEFNDAFVLVPAPRKVDTGMWPEGMISTRDSKTLDYLVRGFDSMSIVDMIVEEQLNNFKIPLEEDDMMIINSEMIDSLTDFATPIDMNEIDYTFGSLYSQPLPEGYNYVTVPETGSWLATGFLPLVLLGSRRRR